MNWFRLAVWKVRFGDPSGTTHGDIKRITDYIDIGRQLNVFEEKLCITSTLVSAEEAGGLLQDDIWMDRHKMLDRYGEEYRQILQQTFDQTLGKAYRFAGKSPYSCDRGGPLSV